MTCSPPHVPREANANAEVLLFGPALTQPLPGVTLTQVDLVHQARRAIESGGAELVLVDDVRVERDGGDEVGALCQLSRQLGGPPVVLLAREGVSPELLETAWRAGVDDCILRPVVAEGVHARVHPKLHDLSHGARAPANRGRVAICAHDHDYEARARDLLELSGFEVLSARLGNVPSPEMMANVELDAVCVVSGRDAMQGINLLSRTLAVLRRGGRRDQTHTMYVSRAPMGPPGEGATHVIDANAPVEALVERLNKLLNLSSTSLLTRERLPFFCPVDFRSAGGATSGAWDSGFSFNISAGGLFVRTLQPLRKGSAVEMRVRLTTMRETIAATGVVAWANPPRGRTVFSYPVGMGIAFLGALSPRLKSLIDMCRALVGSP